MAVRRIALALVAATALGSALIHAQIPGRNVNMVSGTKLPDGDPFLQRQNEPSVAASTRNPLHLLAGANDYRTVDLPGINGADETGDAWLGVFKSVDGGQRWTSTLIPGYPQDPLRNQSPLKSYGAAADPVVRAGTNGLIYYAGLAFNRGTNGSSAVFVSRFIDDNNRERRDPFSYLSTSIVTSDTGVTGRLLDKPWIAVDIPRDTRTCPVTTTIVKPPASPGGQPTTVTETHNLPAGPVYVAYAAFTGSGSTLKSDIMFQYSVNCGVTWSAPVRLSAADGSVNQGVTIAIEPNTGAVTVAWRRFTKAGSTQTDAIMVAQSLTLGRLFASPLAIRKLPRLKSLFRVLESILEHRRQQGGTVIEELTEFDAKTAPNSDNPTGIQTRTNTYPTMAWDDKGRLYVAWSERGFSTSPDPQRRDPLYGDAKIVMSSALLGLAWSAPKAVSETNVSGHQFMPSLAFAGGKLLLVYYDLREDIAQLYGPFFDDKDAATSSGKRHTLDIRASLGTPGTLTPAFAPSVRVSDYFIGHRAVPNPQNFIPCPADTSQLDCEQLQFNPPNLRMFKQGTVPFIGDYIDISPAPAFVPSGRGGWAYNTARSAVPIFNAVWTDNRDVRPPADGDWTHYTPPNLEGTTSHVSPIDGSTVACNPAGDNFGSRNQNVYTARITGGLLVGSPGNSKPLSQTLQRGFVVFAQNMTSVVKTFRMQVATQPVGGFASFKQIFTQPLTFIDVVVPARSTASRTLYVTSTDEHARVTVNVFEIPQAGTGTPTPNGLTGNIILNADIENADIENADIENADIENADIENTAFADAPKTDVTWSVTNTGNTTSAFNVNLFLSQNAPTAGVKTQLILHKAYLTPAAASCDLKVRSHTVLVANITNPNFVTPTGTIPDPNSPASNNATLYLGPKEKGYITLRLHDTDPTNNVIIINDKGQPISVDAAFVPGTTLAPIVVAQEIGTEDLNNGVTTPPITTTDGSTMFFLTQPTTAVAGVVMNPVRLQVRDKSGAVLPGVDVTLSLGTNPTNTVLGGVLTQTTDATGVATFDTLQISTPGDGYRLRAIASRNGGDIGITPAVSIPFTVKIVVLNTADAGPGSLRSAILLANANLNVRDVITFSLPLEGSRTITLQSPLPGLDDPVVLDGTATGVCTGGPPTVEINAGTTTQHGLFVGTAPGSVIRGLSITGFAGSSSAGIFVSSSGFGTTIECNYIGLGLDGRTVKRNFDGIRIGFAGNTVGGTSATSRNVISGNSRNGIYVQGPTPDSTGGFAIQNIVRNNYIGTDATGTGWNVSAPACHPATDLQAPLSCGNLGNGVEIENAQLNVVASNVISANFGEGVRINGFRSTGNVIQGNYIGTDQSGTVDVGNAASGVYIRRAGQNSVIGNLISGNDGFAGIAICGTPTFCGGGTDTGLSADASGNIIKGNIIGLNGTATGALGNAGYGISLDGAPNTIVGDTPIASPAANQNIISANAVGIAIFGTGADGNVIRGNYIGSGFGTQQNPSPNFGNVGDGILIQAGSDNIVSGIDTDRYSPNAIFYSGGAGIRVNGGTRNMLRLNNFISNTGLGIDLGPLGVTPNDPLDADAGANDLQNFPILTSARLTGTTLAVQGSLNSTPFTQFTVELYSAAACDASGNGEGSGKIASFLASTGSDGNVSFNRVIEGSGTFPAVPAGFVVTALVTQGDFVTIPGTTGSTSEFSNCVIVGSDGGAVTDPSGDAVPPPSNSGVTISPDLVSTTVVNTGTALVFQVRYAPGTFDPETTTAQLMLDTDQNAATGHSGIDSSCGPDAGVLGSEFIVNADGAGSTETGSAIGNGSIFQYLGTCNAFGFVEAAGVTIVASGYDITVDLATITDDGILNYKVVTFVPGSGVIDVMPDVGSAPGTTGGVIIP